MRKILPIVLVGALPMLGQAAGDHAGGHEPAGARRGDGASHGHSGAHERAATPATESAVGRPGDPAKVSRTIEVSMDDRMRFVPDRIRVKAGETIRFFVRNTGRLRHEMVLGTMSGLRAHAAMMRAQPDMQHADANMISVGPGKLGGMVWRFERAGTVHFACLVPGHLEGGMVGRVEVE